MDTNGCSWLWNGSHSTVNETFWNIFYFSKFLILWVDNVLGTFWECAHSWNIFLINWETFICHKTQCPFLRQHHYVLPVCTYTLTWIEPTIFCSWGECDGNDAMPPAQLKCFLMLLRKRIKVLFLVFCLLIVLTVFAVNICQRKASNLVIGQTSKGNSPIMHDVIKNGKWKWNTF
jgi:hypothetical protein